MESIIKFVGLDENTLGKIVPRFNVAPRFNDPKCWNNFIRQMSTKNTYCPELTRIIYNVGSKAYPMVDENGNHIKDENGKLKYGEPVQTLTTVVFFEDGTKSVVTNSVHDGVKFMNVSAVEGDLKSPTVTVATPESKEVGLVYAFLKKLFGEVDKNGTVLGNGFGRKLANLVESAYDTDRERAANKYKNKRAKELDDARRGTAKPKRPSFAETVVDLRAATDNLLKLQETMKSGNQPKFV